MNVCLQPLPAFSLAAGYMNLILLLRNGKKSHAIHVFSCFLMSNTGKLVFFVCLIKLGLNMLSLFSVAVLSLALISVYLPEWTRSGQKSNSNQRLPLERTQEFTDTQVISSNGSPCLAAIRSAKGSEKQAANVIKKP